MIIGNTVLDIDERVISRYIPFSTHVTDEIIACDNNEYIAVIKVAGRSPDAYSKQDQAKWVQALHNVLKSLPFGSVGLYSHIIRRKVTEYPQSTFKQSFATKFDSAYRDTFNQRGLMVNDLYLTVCIHPVDDALMGALASMEKANESRIELWQSESIEKLQNALRTLEAGLSRYDPQVLKIVNRDGFAFSETAEFLAFLLNGEHQQVPVSKERIRDVIPKARPIFSTFGEIGELRYPDKSRYFGMMELRSYPETTQPGNMDRLLSLPYEFILTQSWGSFSKAAAKKLVKKHRRLLIDSGDDSVTQVKQLEQAQDDLTGGRLGFGDHHATILVFEESPEAIRQALANTSTSLAEDAIGFLSLTKALEAAFWAQLPANWHWRPRPVPITSLNFLCLSSLHNQLTGKPAGNPWGAAVTMLKTRTGSPYFFNFHSSTEDVDETGKRRPGNTMIIGMTGTGKTVLQGMLLTQAQKFGATSIVWDKDQGMQVLIMALGGKYFNIRLGEKTGWNPFQIEPNSVNTAFMTRLVVYLAEKRGETVSTSQRAAITEAVRYMTTLIDKRDRSLSTLNTLLPNPYSEDDTKSTVHARLQPWCTGGEYGWVFDNPEDLLSLSTDEENPAIFGFDLTELLDDDIVRGAVTMYLKHRVDALHDGRRIINLYDECQHPLKDLHFQDSMQDASRTIRKKNGVLAFATQEPGAIINNPVGPSLIQQSATMIFLPNPKAVAKEYIDGFGLTRSEFDLLMSLGEASRKFLVKQGSNVTVAQLDLNGCDDELLVFSGSPDMAEIAMAAQKEAGEDPKDWLPVYLSAVKRQR